MARELQPVVSRALLCVALPLHVSDKLCNRERDSILEPSLSLGLRNAVRKELVTDGKSHISKWKRRKHINTI